MSLVRLRATVVFEYEANPDHYEDPGSGVLTAEGMALLDQAVWPEWLIEAIMGMDAADVSVTISPVTQEDA